LTVFVQIYHISILSTQASIPPALLNLADLPSVLVHLEIRVGEIEQIIRKT